MSEIQFEKKGKPDELIRAEKFIDDAKVNEAHDLLNNFERKEGLTLHEKISSRLLKCDLLNQQGRFGDALTLAEETYDLSIGLGENLQSVDCLISMATSMSWLGKLDEVLDVVNQGEELLKNLTHVLSSKRMKREAFLGRIKGGCYLVTGEIELCLKYYEQSLGLAEKTGFKRLNAIILRSFAYIYATKKGDVDLALEYIKKGTAIAKESKNKFTIAQCLLVLGEIFRFKGDWERGLKLYKESLSIYEELGNKERMATILNNMAETYRDFTNDINQAAKYIEKSFSMFTSDEYHLFDAEKVFSAISITLKKGDLEQTKKYFELLEQMNSQVKNKHTNLMYRTSKALILKESSRFRDIVKAEKILREIIGEEIFDFEITTLALVNLCDLLLYEFRVTGNLEILNELEPLIAQLLSIAEKSHSYWIMGETYLLQASLALITLNLKEARQFLTQGQRIAEKHGLKLLALKISNEHDEFLKQLNMWENLEESSSSLNERMELARLNEQMGNTLRKRVVEPDEIQEEESVVILIISEGGNPIFSQSFVEGWSFQDNLFGGFLSAVNSFSDEMFSQGLDRAIFGEYTIIMNAVSPFIVCYLFKGQSFLAQQRMKHFIDTIQNNKKIWKPIKNYYQANRLVQEKDIPLLDLLVNEIFIKRVDRWLNL